MSAQNPDQDDLRPQYDFSQGTRGKHAARFSVPREGPAPASMREAIRYDRQVWISEALRRFQELERLLGRRSARSARATAARLLRVVQLLPFLLD